MTPAVSVVVSAAELSERFAIARSRLNVELRRALDRTVEVASMYAKQTRLFKHRSYELRNSVRTRVVGDMGGAGFVGQVSANAPYAGFLEFGTKAHAILPRRKKFLRFIQNGQVRFSRGVWHPGTSPRPFMRGAQERATPLFEQLVSEAFVRAFA